MRSGTNTANAETSAFDTRAIAVERSSRFRAHLRTQVITAFIAGGAALAAIVVLLSGESTQAKAVVTLVMTATVVVLTGFFFRFGGVKLGTLPLRIDSGGVFLYRSPRAVRDERPLRIPFADIRMIVFVRATDDALPSGAWIHGQDGRKYYLGTRPRAEMARLVEVMRGTHPELCQFRTNGTASLEDGGD